MRRNRTKRLAALLAMIIFAAAPAPAKAAPDADPQWQTLAFPAVARGTKPFGLVGITWTDPNARIDGTIQVRTRDLRTGRWTGWRALEADGTATGARRGSTDPLWVGRSDGVETRIVGGRRALPAGLRVDLINPEAGRPSARIESAPARTSAPMPARPVPRMVTRAGWGANETIVRSAPAYTGPVRVFFVHHTATGNGYSCRDSAAVVRGIQAYQIRTRGWDDIGYNFLVDKCGTIFEGRGGGVGRTVLGAHTLGFNTDASSIAVIGTYDSVGVSPAVRTAIATVAAYKLGAAGNPPNGKVVYTSGGGTRYPPGQRVTMYRISGHRDAGRTDCPGDSLYRQLPQIRAIAGAAPIGLRLLRVPGAVKLGPLLYTRGLIRPLWNVSTPSALIARFEIRVDGKPAIAAPGSHRTTALRLAPGGHTVEVRAVHLSGRAATTAVRVVSDATAPVFTYGPDVALRTGSLDGSVPIRLGWRATDVNGLSAVRLLRPAPIDLGVATRSRTGTIKPAVPTTFGLRATDRSGNAAGASVTRTPIVMSEGVARRTGIWHVLRNPCHLGGVALGSTTAGSTASWTFTGRSAALAVSRAAGSGRMRIWVDGADQGAIDLGAPTTRYRQAVWTRYWSSNGTHTVRISVERPGVVLDGLVFLK